jgi:hypothetical protein
VSRILNGGEHGFSTNRLARRLQGGLFAGHRPAADAARGESALKGKGLRESGLKLRIKSTLIRYLLERAHGLESPLPVFTKRRPPNVLSEIV